MLQTWKTQAQPGAGGPELALPDLLLLKTAAPFLARLRHIGADTHF